MKVPFRTLALFALALAMIGVGYVFGPAPGAQTLPSEPVAKAMPAPARPDSTLVASRPPVPLVTAPRPSYVAPTTDKAADKPSDKPADKPTVNMGTFSTNPPSTNPSDGDKIQALAMQAPGMGPASGDDSQARKAIEFDGYRNVRGLEKGPDGLWHGRAMRGRTEIAVRVDAGGNVSAE